ncbi:MAG: hypothetical protein KDA32_04445 [Phycisphaerales bacterium]|nr:hypothetical protein [Phycisphaerales bacterium]
MSFPTDVQIFAFRWAATQTAMTMMVLFMFGMLFNFQGFRFGRLVCGLIAGLGGLVIGEAVAPLLGQAQVSGTALGIGVAVVLFLVSVLAKRAAIFLSSIFTSALLVFYMSNQLGIKGDAQWIMMAAGGGLGLFLPMMMKRHVLIILTVVQGAAMMIVAFIGLTNAAAPSLSGTLREWAATYPLLMPMFLLMISVMGYSFQANAKQGDMTTGGSFAETVTD